MPRGQAARRRPGRPAKDAPPTIAYEKVARSMMYTLDEELSQKGGEARARIINDFDNALEAVEKLAYGIRVQRPVATEAGLACGKCGTAVSDVVYHVPPFWPALRWMLEWGRQIIKEEPKKTVEHEYPPEVLEAMRRYVDGPSNGHAVPLLPTVNEQGVINLRDDDIVIDSSND